MLYRALKHPTFGVWDRLECRDRFLDDQLTFFHSFANQTRLGECQILGISPLIGFRRYLRQNCNHHPPRRCVVFCYVSLACRRGRQSQTE